MKAHFQVIVSMQERDSTREFITPENYSSELQKVCATEPVDVDPTDLLCSRVISCVVT